jgi:hypothetical protein
MTIFPCADTISWILKHIYLENYYILNYKGKTIISFQATDTTKYYHLEKGTQSLDDELINKFPQKVKDLFKIQYKPDKMFKIRLSRKYPTYSLRIPYQYIVVMLCNIYWEQYSSKFTLFF